MHVGALTIVKPVTIVRAQVRDYLLNEPSAP